MAEADAAAAVALLALPHLDAAFNLARWLVRDGALAEDVVQDALVRALTYAPSFRGENPRAWLLQIVRTVAYDTLAARPRRRESPLDDGMASELVDPGDDPEMALARNEAHATLAAAPGALPADLREVIVLRELEEMSYRDIARVVQVPIGTVMSRLWRARQALMQTAGRGQA